MAIYVNYDGIQGEATQQDHKKWIDILSLSWGVGRGISTVTGNSSGREVAEPSVSEVTLVKMFDSATPKLFTEALVGNQGKTVKIDLVSSGNPGVTYCTYTLSNALISSYSVSTSGDRPTESVSIDFTKLEFKFTPYDDKNKEGTPVTVTYDLGTKQQSSILASGEVNAITPARPIVATYEDASHKISALIGSASGDHIEGTDASEVLNGLSGDDIFHGKAGNDFANGGKGVDVIRYEGMRSEFDVSTVRTMNETNQLGKDLPEDLLKFVDLALFNIMNGEVRTVSDKVAERNGTDTLSDVERIQFTDGSLLFDVIKNDSNSALYRLYKATFDRSPDQNGFLGWIDQIKNGSEIIQIAKDFMKSDEFVQKFGASTHSDTAFVNLLYRNALGRDGDQVGAKGWVEALQSGQLSRADVLLAFATSQEATVKTAGNIDNGYWVV